MWFDVTNSHLIQFGSTNLSVFRTEFHCTCGNFGNAKELFLVYLENADSFFMSDVNYCWLIDSLHSNLLL